MNAKTNLTLDLTVCVKSGPDPLSKRIGIDSNGELVVDNSVCRMTTGAALHVELTGLAALGPLFSALSSQHAITLGVIRPEHRPAPGQVIQIITKDSLKKAKANGGLAQPTIARTREYITFEEGRPALILFDFDSKGLPPALAARMQAAGGFWPLLGEIFPLLKGLATVERASTSAGLVSPAGQSFADSGGRHVYAVVLDGADINRTLKVMQEKLWLLDCGWHMVSAAGSLLKRSLVDASVGLPERLIFEGPPELRNGLTQDPVARQPVHTPGEILDTKRAFPDLTAAERATYEGLVRASEIALKPEREKVVKTIIEKEAKELVKTGMPLEKARARAEERVRWRLDQYLLAPDTILHFDELGEVTVAEVLADPDTYLDETLCDPIEGPSYGYNKAKVFRAYDGNGLIIRSFAHGGRTFKLIFDEDTIAAVLASCDPRDIAERIAAMLVESPYAKGSPAEDRLITSAAKQAKCNKMPIKTTIKAARSAAAKAAAKAAQAQQAAQRQDPRPLIRSPHPNVPWLPEMAVLNEVIGTVAAAMPPVRNINADATRVHMRQVANMHAFVDANEPDGDDE